MFNEYIYEKKLNEEKQKQIENEKQIHFKKLYLKRREKLSRQYNKKIHSFMQKLLSEMEPIKKSYFARYKIHGTSSKKEADIYKRSKSNLIERIHSYSPTYNNTKKEKKKPFFSPLKNIDSKTINCFELPKMNFSKKSDFERIKENIVKRDGKEFDEEFLRKLSEKYKKSINKQTFSFLKTNQNKNKSDSINKIYPANKKQKIFLEQNNDTEKKEEWNKNQKYYFFKNKLLNSKLIIDITNNEKYKSKTFYQGLIQSLLLRKNNNNVGKNKYKKNNPIITHRYNINKIFNKRTKKDKDDKIYANSINFYQDRLKKFDKLFHKHKDDDKNYSGSDESSDSSFNDNGQKEIIKKIITLHYPLLRENDNNKRDELKNNLQYLKNMFIKDKKELYQDEEIKKNEKNEKIDNEILNYLSLRKKNEIDKKKKYIFLNNKDIFDL